MLSLGADTVDRTVTERYSILRIQSQGEGNDLIGPVVPIPVQECVNFLFVSRPNEKGAPGAERLRTGAGNIVRIDADLKSGRQFDRIEWLGPSTACLGKEESREQEGRDQDLLIRYPRIGTTHGLVGVTGKHLFGDLSYFRLILPNFSLNSTSMFLSRLFLWSNRRLGFLGECFAMA